MPKSDSSQSSSSELLKNIYYDVKHPSAFSSPYELLKSARKKNPGLKLKDVKNWLSSQDAYTLHKQLRRNFPRRKTLAKGIDYQWQADLAVMENLKKYNDGYKYLLTVIDIFSRYAFVVPLKTKTSTEVLGAFKTLFKVRKPTYLQTDHGTEFHNEILKSFLKKENVTLFSTHSDQHASLVERLNRTLKSSMYRYFSAKNTLRYIDVLGDFVSAYNNRVHRSIGMKPSEVNKQNESEVWKKQYQEHILGRRCVKFKYKIGDKVRLTKLRKTFDKGYLPKWTQEFFTITGRISTNPPVYKISDLQGTQLKGIFYTEELQLIRPGEDDAYKIHVLRTRKRRGKTEYFVHYVGWPASFDEWVGPEQLTDV